MKLEGSLDSFEARVSFLEIYNEHIIDLIAKEAKDQKTLTIRENPQTGVYVEGLTEVSVSTCEEVFGLLKEGALNRKVGATDMNVESSRSHSVFTIYLKRERGLQELKKESSLEGTFEEPILNPLETLALSERWLALGSCVSSMFHFVDLAGSERQKLTQSQGERFKEGCMINKSLLLLGNVIS